MILLILFAFLAGVVTILSPCILPILPIILSSSVDSSGKKRPLGVVIGFIASFTFFTLFLSSIVKVSGISAGSLRYVSIVILVVFGLSLLIPKFQLLIEQLFSRFARLAPNGTKRQGFAGGVVVGLTLGLLWTPCVGPILASVISLALSGSVTYQAAIITLSYSVGTALPMFLIMSAGSNALKRVPWLLSNTAKIQKAFGVLMVVTALGIYFNVDRAFQTFILDTFPRYGSGLTTFEDNTRVKDALENIDSSTVDPSDIGKPMSDLTSKKGYPAPEIVSRGQWFNSDPLKISELKGKVVLVDFWTYSCINCQRTFPYLRDWWKKYEDDGLVIIGVHAPEFEFEKDAENVAKALRDFDLNYPVVQDNNFATWRAYNNRYWPAKYIINKDGNVVYTHFGEGDYAETEKIIQDLLKEAGAVTITESINDSEYDTYSRTPETYLGYVRIARFSSPEQIVSNTISSYSFPTILQSNEVAFEGEWTVRSEYANPSNGASLRFNFEAKEVFLVMRPKGDSARVRVIVDGKSQFAGVDVVNGIAEIKDDTLYKLINAPEPGSHILELEFLDGNSELYAFTFG